jgi:tetratricopeptide (TPR) repeat protein
VGTIVVVALAVTVLPGTVLSLYHQQCGERLLVRALLVEGRTTAGRNGLLFLEPLAATAPRALAESASTWFRAAHDVNPDNAQAYRWSGQTALLLDKPAEAVMAFSTYIEMRPDNPFGWWELGLAYERLAQQLPDDTYVLVEPARRAVVAWREGGFTAQDFINAGEEARRAKQPAEALAWYGRAARMEPELGDPWYYMGLTYEGLEQWNEALEAYRTATGSQVRMLQIPRGSMYYRIGSILQWHTDPRPTDEIVKAYDLALADGRFVSTREEADVHYSRGVIHWWRRPATGPEQYMVEFETALQLNPQHAWAALLLGRAYFLDLNDLTQARSYTDRSIGLQPGNPWGYLYSGDILLAEGQADQARAQYQKALDLAPDFSEAQERLRGLDEEQ